MHDATVEDLKGKRKCQLQETSKKGSDSPAETSLLKRKIFLEYLCALDLHSHLKEKKHVYFVN